MPEIFKTLRYVIYHMRRFVFTSLVKLKCKTYITPLYVNRRSNVTRNTILAKNVNFNGMNIKGSGVVKIGNNFHSGEGCLLITQNHDYDNGEFIPYGTKDIIKDVTIEDNVWIGDRVIILGGVTIGEGAIIQAGSVVVNDIPKFSIAGGHPASVFSSRNVSHYEDLKSKNRYL